MVAGVLEFLDVGVRRGREWILDRLSWSVDSGERWVVMGPNGAGKSTLMQIAAARLHPTSGQVRILGEELGAVDVAELRMSIGWASGALVEDVPGHERVRDVVLTGAWSVTGRWREAYSDDDARRADALLSVWGLAELGSRTFGTLSEGERKRALLARSLMADPELLLLDEPGAGLDLGGREGLIDGLAQAAADPRAPAMVVVTHHVEEIPAGFTHALLMRTGRVIAAGPIQDVLTDDPVSSTFGLPLMVRCDEGRWTARRASRTMPLPSMHL